MHHRENRSQRHQQARFLRPDAHRWMRPDAAKFLRPGTDPADVYPALAQRREQLQREHDRAIVDAIEHERTVLAVLRAELNEIRGALLRRRLAREEQKYSASQPRVPAGNGRPSGRWSSGSYGNRPRVIITKPDVDSGDAGDGSGADTGSGASFSAFDVGDVSSEAGSLNLFNITPRDNSIGGLHLAGDDDRGAPQIDLLEERELGGHTVERHVGRSTESSLDDVRGAQRYYREVGSGEGLRAGSFSSLQSANKLINSTLAQNPDQVESVASGSSPREEVEGLFRSVTGYEAYARNERSQAELRTTYGVRVVIVRDQRASKGYRVDTAFPVTPRN